MNNKPSTASPSGRTVIVTRVADGQWHVLDDDLVAGRGHAVRRPDGRLFVSIDAWHDAAFDRLAEVMLADLPAPLYTVVDEADLESTSRWQRAGFAIRRREWDFSVPTDPHVTGLEASLPPPGVRVVPAGAADERLLYALDRMIREEVEAGPGWQSMPAEVRPRPAGVTIVDPSRYTVAAAPDRCLGLVRLATATRQPRIGLIAVRAGERRRGIARALLSHVLGTLHAAGIATVSAEVDESNAAALALFEGIAGRRTGSSLELAR
jgi:GNAT superfamily N-acetyltransferase